MTQPLTQPETLCAIVATSHTKERKCFQILGGISEAQLLWKSIQTPAECCHWYPRQKFSSKNNYSLRKKMRYNYN